MDRDTFLSLDAMDAMMARWDREDRNPRSIIIDAISHQTESLDWFMRTPRSRGPIILGGRKRTVKGAPPPKANNRRAKVKAARKANRQRKKSARPVIYQHKSATSIRDRDIAAMPIAVEPEFSSPLRIACFAVMGVTVFAALFGALLS